MTQKQLNWNVIDEAAFKGRTRNVFEQVANTLTNTLGPYGSTTIIEKFGEMHITKDGWQILKKIAFDDTIEQNILQLLVNISAQVVIKVGDGSTSSIVSANSILKQLESTESLKQVRPKELINVLSKVVEQVSGEILNNSTKIDIETDPELKEVYRLAMISTNGDEQVSRMIQQIYAETSNPFIEFDKSKTAKTSYEVVEGYQSMATYVDGIYTTNDEGTCEIDNPLILMFDHQINIEHHFQAIIQPALAKAITENRRLVVIAPHYDKFLLQQIANRTNAEFRARGTSQDVYTRISLSNNIFQEQFNDFAILTGGTIIRETMIQDFFPMEEGAEPVAKAEDFIGEVDRMVIGPQKTLAQGFPKLNKPMYEIAMRDAKAKYGKLEQTHSEMNIVDSQLYELKKRISKLSGKMGIIHVGGNSSLEKTSNYDLVEDAVKACESAYNYGYNMGGNLIIPVTISKVLKEKYPLECTERTVLVALWNAFRDVFTKVLSNKFKDADQAELVEIAEKAIDKELCYDLITDKYSADVINPCHTDIEILRAATSIVALLLSSNQYISIKLDSETEI